jgi:hypothetical protein
MCERRKVSISVKAVTTILICLLMGTSEAQTTGTHVERSAIEVVFWLDKHQCRLGESLAVSYGIRNTSKNVVLIPKDLRLINGPYGGFDIEFVDSKGERVDLPYRSWGASLTSLLPPEQRTDDFLALDPGYFYGFRVLLSNLPKKRGRYKMVARFTGPSPMKDESPTARSDRFVRGSYQSKSQFVGLN